MTEYTFQADISKFVADNEHYDGEKALFLADCAQLAYENEATIRKVMQDQLGFKRFYFFTGKSTQGFVAANDKIIVVAFRGTEMKLDDFLRDAQLKPEQGPVGKVHTGFHKGLHEVWGAERGDESVQLKIDGFADNNQSIWFCGHSLGAALATLAAIEYVFKGQHKEAVKGVYTIGQPRVGDNEFAMGFDMQLGEQCFRFVNNNDVVTRIPLPGIFLKYTHVGQQLYFDSKGRLRDSIPWWKKLWESIRGIKTDLGHIGLDALEDHGKDVYVNLIKKNRAVKTKWS